MSLHLQTASTSSPDTDVLSSSLSLSSSCDVTCGCPHLYHATKSFVLTLCILATVLVLPLLCLPCVYVWILRGATEDALEAAARGNLGRNFGDGDDSDEINLMSRWTVDQVLDQMEQIRLTTTTTKQSSAAANHNHADTISSSSSSSKSSSFHPSHTKQTSKRIKGFLYEALSQNVNVNVNAHEDEHESQPIQQQMLMQQQSRELDYPKECCICMSEFDYSATRTTNTNPQIIIRTKCGHVFHRDCLGGWLGGHWDNSSRNNNNNNNSANNNIKATRRVCPLCRQNLIPETSPPPSPPPSP